MTMVAVALVRSRISKHLIKCYGPTGSALFMPMIPNKTCEIKKLLKMLFMFESLKIRK
jgi:hypothetical protein